MAGCSVFTRPSRISGKPVTASTACTGTPPARSAAKVPPVEMMSHPRSTSPWANCTIPLLSLTDISARATAISSRREFHRISQGDRPAGSRRAQHDRGQELMFGAEHTSRECLGGVTGEHRYPRLGENGAPIVLLVHQVDGGAGELRAAGEHGLVHPVAVHPGAAKGRQQG